MGTKKLREPDEEKFLKELNKLTRKYGVAVCGCGCCGSPYTGTIPPSERGKDFHYRRDNDLCYLRWREKADA